MIPLKDNLRYLGFAWVSITIFVINVLVFIGELTLMTSANMDSTISTWLPVRQAVINAVTTGDPVLLGKAGVAMFLAMFMHSGFMHIFGNMCFFFAFAPALEARMGHAKFAIFYLVSGMMASLVFLLTDTDGVAHIMGASGAIGGVLGAYLIYFPRARVDGWMPPITAPTTVAVFLLTEFFGMQWLSIWGGMQADAGEAAHVAYWAHIGGITFGMAVAALIVLYDVGLTKIRYKLFYLFMATLTAGSFFVLTYSSVSQMVTVPALALTAVIGTRCFFPRGFKTWEETAGTASITLIVFALLGVCAEQCVLILQGSGGLAQVLAVALVTATIMGLSVLIAIVARGFKPMSKPIVVVPEIAEQDRILSEVVFDLILGFFRNTNAVLHLVVGFVGRWLWFGVGFCARLLWRGVCSAKALAGMAYRRVTPQVVRKGLRWTGDKIRWAAAKLLNGFLALAFRLRLDRPFGLASRHLGRLYIHLA
jgi:membrane associated rhomboid family serine protease